jgi:hypothetical protein
LVLPIHFPHPTAGRVEADGDRFRYRFIRDALTLPAAARGEG